jgi:Fic family protein
MLREIDVSLPPLIAGLEPVLTGRIAADGEDAVRAIMALDLRHGAALRSLDNLLLRTESVASSKIEGLDAGSDAYARATHGIRANSTATEMAAGTEAIAALLGTVRIDTPLAAADVLAAHAVLMRNDTLDHTYAGRWRDVQNWIGGSDHSPRDADYVPPPPESVDGYMRDLFAFANRTDVPVLAHVALLHAQFESIHPFTDGNGRIGRALINAVLRRRGVTTRVVVPIASALVARRDRYFALLSDYRLGDPDGIISEFSSAAQIAAEESMTTAERIRDLPDEWRTALGSVRAGSAVAQLLENLPSVPVFSADEAQAAVSGPSSSVYAAISRLEESGIVRPLTERRRNQVWGVTDVLSELDDLSARIARRARD